MEMVTNEIENFAKEYEEGLHRVNDGSDPSARQQ